MQAAIDLDLRNVGEVRITRRRVIQQQVVTAIFGRDVRRNLEERKPEFALQREESLKA
jgi:hypothetical protein